jgi:hypothetical protein
MITILPEPNKRYEVLYFPGFMSTVNSFETRVFTFAQGYDLAYFRGYYEPWGYTAAECISLGVPTVISNVSSLGGFMMKCSESERSIKKRPGDAPPKNWRDYSISSALLCPYNRTTRLILLVHIHHALPGSVVSSHELIKVGASRIKSKAQNEL